MRLSRTSELAGVLSRLPENPRIITQGSFATPFALLNLIDEQLERYRLFLVNGLPGIPARKGVRYETVFVGQGMRGYPDLDYYPSRLSLAGRLFHGPLSPDLVLVQVSRVVGGKVSLGIEVQVIPDALDAAIQSGALIIAQLNSNMPFVHGDGVLDVDLFDAIFEIDDELPVPAVETPDETAELVGENVGALVPDGATIQAGIGAVPSSVLSQLTNHREMRVWTELLTDGFRQLQLHGALDDRFPLVASFAFGPREFYDWIDDNPQVQMLACRHTNNPGIISNQPNMTSINAALQVDLFGEANASRVNHRIFSGTGGQTDFFVGALHARGGQAIMALKSWYPKRDVSRIVAKLDEPTTSMQFTHVVTEYGSARVFGATQVDQARGIISIANPRARAELAAQAAELGIDLS